MKINNITDLRNLSWPVHDWLKKNNLKLLEQYFDNTFIYKQKILLTLNKGIKINYKSPLYFKMQSIFRKDKIFKAMILKKYPGMLRSDTLTRMLQIMPKNVKLMHNQEWKGTNHWYMFIHNKYGKWEADASKLISRTWPEGRSGHPTESKLSKSIKKSKTIKNLNTGEMFSSIKAAANKYKLTRSNMTRALNNKHTTYAGYHWAYCDKNGKIIP